MAAVLGLAEVAHSTAIDTSTSVDAGEPAKAGLSVASMRGAFVRLLAALAGLVVVMLVLYLVGSSTQRASERNGETSTRLAVAVAEIRYYDELLTMSARLAAATGDASYVDRYRLTVPKLDRAIDEAFSVAPDPAAMAALNSVDEANQRLITLEGESFRLLAADDRTAAYGAITSEEYAELKARYHRGLGIALERMSAAVEGNKADAASRQRMQLVVQAAALLALAALWFTTARGRSRGRRDLRVEQQLRSDLERVAAEFEHASLHDGLTGVANRAAFDAHLPRALARCRPDGRTATLVLVDLDAFKAINDIYGHAAGDAVLQATAVRLAGLVRDGDLVARLGGDEFAVVIEEGDVRTALVLAERALTALAEPVHLDETIIVPSARVGLHAPRPGEPAGEAMVCADAALSAAKKSGDGFELYDPVRHRRFLERYQIELELRAAPKRDELVLHYQPVLDLATRRVVGVEGLVRWDHPVRGLLAPGAFIDIAEESGAIVELGRWVLAQGCRDARDWQARPGGLGVGVALNVSRRQLATATILDDVRDAIDDSGVSPALITLEVTETALMADTDEIIEKLHKIKALGVALAMDDFGTGYSSLAHLRALPIDVLKIDKAFVDGIAREEEEWALAAAIIRLASSLGKRTLAEGIERASQLAHLRSLGCELGQGWLFARAMPLAELIEYLGRAPGRPTAGIDTSDHPRKASPVTATTSVVRPELLHGATPTRRVGP